MPLGADWTPRYNVGEIKARVDTRYILKTDDGAMISLFTEGVLRGHVFGLIKGTMSKKKDASLYYFRQHLFFSTGDARYAWLNTAVGFAVIGIGPDKLVCYDAYMLT